MPNILLSFNDASARAVALLDDGTITLAGASGGAWTTDGSHDTNELQYILPDKTKATAKPTYTMEMATNRLIVTIGNSATKLNGRISLEGHEGILYTLVDSDGFALESDDGELGFHVYGKVTIDPKANTLTVVDSHASATTKVVITGTSAAHAKSAVTTGLGKPNDDGVDTDLLRFHAQTTESFPNAAGGTDSFLIDARIDLNGSWDLKDGQHVFSAQVEMSSGTRLIDIMLVGRLKAMAYSLQFTEVGDITNVFFEIAGQLKGTNTDGKWALSLGFSNKLFHADLSVDRAPRNGTNGFTIHGSLQLQGTVTGKINIVLELEVAYKFNNGSIDLKVNGRNGQYSLEVSGTLNLDVAGGFKVKFSVDTSTNGKLKSFDLEFGPANPGSSLNNGISGSIGWDGKSVTIDLNVEFDWVGGHLFPKNPPPKPN